MRAPHHAASPAALLRQVIEQNGSAEDKRNAALVRPLVEQHHFLLVTLLLTNATAMESLPLFLDRLVPQWLAVALSVTLVLLFGARAQPRSCAATAASAPLRVAACPGRTAL